MAFVSAAGRTAAFATTLVVVAWVCAGGEARAGGDISGCYGAVVTGLGRSPARAAEPEAQWTCGKDAHASARGLDGCFLLCGVCSSDTLSLGHSPSSAATCAEGARGGDVSRERVVAVAVEAVLNVTAMHGDYWLTGPGGTENNATACLAHLLAYMPRRDMQLLFTDTFAFLDFLVEHVRFALLARTRWPTAAAVPWHIFLDHVLPYAVIDEKRDLFWRWRPRFFRLFFHAVAATANIEEAMHALTVAVPRAESLGALASESAGSGTGGGGGIRFRPSSELVPGPPITWQSSTAPARLSPQQVAQMGGSCTGTAIVLVAAARSVGIPARLAGCSESVPNDDHHWVEFYSLNATALGPFGDAWHTKEGVSAGNAGGPWDAPSGPMRTCLQHVERGDSMHSMWASAWSSDVFLPTLWHRGPWAEQWGFAGGVNRCGAYCGAWGCGKNQTDRWSQAECFGA